MSLTFTPISNQVPANTELDTVIGTFNSQGVMLQSNPNSYFSVLGNQLVSSWSGLAKQGSYVLQAQVWGNPPISFTVTIAPSYKVGISTPNGLIEYDSKPSNHVFVKAATPALSVVYSAMDVASNLNQVDATFSYSIPSAAPFIADQGVLKLKNVSPMPLGTWLIGVTAHLASGVSESIAFPITIS